MKRLLLLSLFLSLLMNQHSHAQSTWPFVYEDDPFSDEAAIDLRSLNEEYAGEHGFITLSKDGNDFVTEDGRKIRIWAVNGGSLARKLSDEDLAYYARFLAKMGVNMIRYHGCISPKGEDTEINEVDTTEVDHIWRLVAAMKKEGIYSTISPFWAHNGHMGGWIPEKWGIDGYSGKDALWGVMYFNDRLKQAYKTWVKYLYTRKNPYTGIALKDEPAVGLIQIKNEDGVFFWTMQHIKPELRNLIVKKYSAWLINKYGSLKNALASWENFPLPGDDPENGKLDIFQFYDLTLDKTGPEAMRVKDQVEFYAHTQYSFYKEMYDYYWYELGCNQLINANNWKTGDPRRLNDLERYTNTSCDVLAVNRYYSPNHVGENNGWRIDPGHHYKSVSSLRNPAAFPLNIKQVDGHPMLVTESGWNFPQKYMAEAPFLVSTYLSLTGLDGYYWFCPTAKAYDEKPYFTWHTYEDGQHPMLRWSYSHPGGIALFPANALQYRLGYIAGSDNIVLERRSIESLLKREVPLISEAGGFDPNRDKGFVTNDHNTKLSPLLYLTGRISVDYMKREYKSNIDETLLEYMKPDQGLVLSETGECTWNYKGGIFTLNTASAKGVCGFLGNKGVFRLDGLTISSQNEYAAVNVVAMDGLPISTSEKILIQVGTQYLPTNWQEEKASFEKDKKVLDGMRILNTGKMPWQCENTYVTITLLNDTIKRATLLSTSLYPVQDVPVDTSEGKISLTVPEKTMYLVLE